MKKVPPIAAESGLELTSVRIEPVASHVVVIAEIESRGGIWRITKQELTAHVRRQGIVINPRARKNEARELLSRSEGKDGSGRVRGGSPGVVKLEEPFCLIQNSCETGKTF